jgi:uncharacterized membrane protein YfcA
VPILEWLLGFSGRTNYTKKGLLQPRKLLLGVLFTFFGAAAGAIAVQYFDAKFLESFIIIMLVVIFIYTFLSPNLGAIHTKAKVSQLFFYTLFGFTIGFYDGFFGPGTGSFWTIALILMLGLNLKAATAQTKLFNFTSNIVSLAVFIYSGLVLWVVGVVMGAGQIIGAYLGSSMVAKREVKFIRYIFLIVVGVTIIKLSFEYF